MSTKIFCHAQRKERRPPSEDPTYQAELQRAAAERKERELWAKLVREERKSLFKRELAKRPEPPPTRTLQRPDKSAFDMTDDEIVSVLDNIIAHDGKARMLCRRAADRECTMTDAQMTRIKERVFPEYVKQIKRLGYHGKPNEEQVHRLIIEGLAYVVTDYFDQRPEKTHREMFAAYMGNSTTTYANKTPKFK